jgi:hypothetical protein
MALLSFYTAAHYMTTWAMVSRTQSLFCAALVVRRVGAVLVVTQNVRRIMPGKVALITFSHAASAFLDSTSLQIVFLCACQVHALDLGDQRSLDPSIRRHKSIACRD